MAGGGKSGGDSYWPGFVDALTNVVIAMIFVVVVLAISLSFAAQMMGKKLAEKIVQEEKAKAALSAASAPVVTPVAQDSRVERPSAAATPSAEPLPTLAASRLPGVTRIPVLPPPKPASAAQVQIQPQPQVDRLQLDYDRQALELDDGAKAALLKALQPLGSSVAQRQVTLVATGPDPSLSDNQRAAYVRLLAVRNVLLEQGFDAARVAVRIDTATATPAPRVYITIE
jgi:hypothetical protein